MRIGVPRETKDGERRVALVPDGARALVVAVHELVIEAGVGAASVVAHPGLARDAGRPHSERPWRARAHAA